MRISDWSADVCSSDLNGVALTALALEQGLRARGHAVSLVRPRQVPGQVPAADETLVRGANLPRYPGLKFGLPATRQLRQLWRDERPEAIYVATEGPLGWSALPAPRRRGSPAATGFNTRFDRYTREYGAGVLHARESDVRGKGGSVRGETGGR